MGEVCRGGLGVGESAGAMACRAGSGADRRALPFLASSCDRTLSLAHWRGDFGQCLSSDAPRPLETRRRRLRIEAPDTQRPHPKSLRILLLPAGSPSRESCPSVGPSFSLYPSVNLSLAARPRRRRFAPDVENEP
jgi:hypothetical protein